MLQSANVRTRPGMAPAAPGAVPTPTPGPPVTPAPEPPTPVAPVRLPPRVLRALVPGLVVASGALLGLAMPGWNAPWAWSVAFVPLFLAWDLILRQPGRGVRQRWGWVLGGAWGVGVVAAALSGDWVVNTAHVYGALPLPLAHGVSLLGLGSLFGLEAFVFLGVPFVLGWRRPGWGLLLMVAWAVALQALVPRFFFWTYGQIVYPVSALVQAADLVGSSGLNALVLPLHLVLAAWLRELLVPGALPRRRLAAATAGVAVLLAAAAGYGQWRLAQVAAAEAAGRPVRLVGIQPNFTLRHLASNPDLAHSVREANLAALLADSERALAAPPPGEEAPRVVLWPESAYPRAYFYDPGLRRVVEEWVRAQGVQVVLATVDFAFAPGERRPRAAYGASVHLRPGGEPPGLYRKMVLIPFGETIPFGSWFPWYRRWLKAWIPQISEFEAGREFTVFPLAPGVRLAPLICFDAVQPWVTRGMARAGANLGVVQANLAWFGRTRIADIFGTFVRFRAVENRMPILLLSQNGRSVLFDAAGEAASRRTGQFTAEALSVLVRVPATSPGFTPSFYTAHGRALHGTYAAALAALLAWGWWRRPHPPAPSPRRGERVAPRRRRRG